ncbi:xanthine dehydrogenase family protein subunit M [Oxalobacteraceae bacterium CAVE-383]|nr:xanthine dehydrogenase family protein subunit M [Oxalobacteraceae bacterium CAVE-383]
MRPFNYQRAADAGQAVRAGGQTGQGQTDAATQYLAGGTTLVDLMKLDVLRPHTLVDLNALRERYGGIELSPAGLHLGAFVKMAAAADHPGIQRDYPALAQSLQLAASAQLRNMATLGGNVLQRTRCQYFRDPSWSACNKRQPGSGCAAIGGANRNFAVLGVDDSCISQSPGDFSIALIAMDAQVEILGRGGAREMPFAHLHRPPAGAPHIETTLHPGDVITGFRIPAQAGNRRSLYLKIRDRASYEFAIASAAVALDMDRATVRHVRIGLGGMAYRPWRASQAEAFLAGKALNEETAAAAAQLAMAGAVTHGDNDYKPELGRQTLIRALLQAAALET